LVFLGTCLLLAMVPGRGGSDSRQAVRDGRRAAMMTVLGNESGLLLWGVAAACGLSVLVTASWMVYDVMRLAGAVALIVWASGRLPPHRRDRVIQVAAAAGPARSSGWHCYRSGLIANLANPKAAVFALSFLPEFRAPGSSHQAIHDGAGGALDDGGRTVVHGSHMVYRPAPQPCSAGLRSGGC